LKSAESPGRAAVLLRAAPFAVAATPAGVGDARAFETASESFRPSLSTYVSAPAYSFGGMMFGPVAAEGGGGKDDGLLNGF
jgi:hypothetical protein